jgi:hypothetical protein
MPLQISTIGLDITSLQTVGTTPVVTTVYTLAANTCVKFRLLVSGLDAGGSGDMIARELTWTAQRIGSNPAALVGSVDSINPKRVGTGISWNTTIGVSGNDVTLTVSGATGLTVDWCGLGGGFVI